MNKLWVAKCAIPGMNIMIYFLSAKKPTREQVQAAWAEGKEDSSVLKWSDEIEGLPLRDCYPGCVGIERLDVTVLS